ncbi:MAG TPA: hypothetical protein VGQ87_00850 [Patescibacteria group bacterium]|jgi:plastocyanin|nr:hypothetical protein [Patescibacteria group bacterium]
MDLKLNLSVSDKIILTTVLAAIILFGVKFQIEKAHGKEYVVELTQAGFVPKQLTIREGDTVKFKTSLSKSFWPASDPHPVHTDYSGFDAKKAIQPNQEWDFKFNNPGNWKYHDHLNVSYTGQIHVLNKNGTEPLVQCTKESTNAKCYDALVVETARTKGIDAAFAVLAQSYDAGQYKAACHWSAHRIGEEAYRLEKQGVPLNITSSTYYCGYGFYHGYLELLLRENPDPNKQKEKVTTFCDYIQSRIQGEARDNCYHGIGSGFTEDPPAQEFWGDQVGVTKKGLEVCGQLFGRTREWEMCTTGVYAVLAKYMSGQLYNFSFKENDPFEFCRNQPQDFHRACYGELAAKLEQITKRDLSKVKTFIKDIPDPGIPQLIVTEAASVMMQTDVLKDDQSEYVAKCRDFGAEFEPNCIDGIVWGLLYHGRIDQEHIKAIKFCNSGSFTQDEKDTCFTAVVARSKSMYSKTKFENICRVILDETKKYCASELTKT